MSLAVDLTTLETKQSETNAYKYRRRPQKSRFILSHRSCMFRLTVIIRDDMSLYERLLNNMKSVKLKIKFKVKLKICEGPQLHVS